ncbi:MAG: hypothetical protein NZ480_04870 [Bdellovibrionaceae bacterium]|nr:hypothetical protein [Pseudobdellovibrionaceae bacterium]MDW8189735.1 hypothetical protein [Pseudobdellovibrionaceae bacterium]
MNLLFYYFREVLGIRYLPVDFVVADSIDFCQERVCAMAKEGMGQEGHLRAGDFVWVDDGRLEQSSLFKKINLAVEQEARRIGRSLQIAAIPQSAVPLAELVLLYPDVHFLVVDPDLFQALKTHLKPDEGSVHLVPHPLKLEEQPALKAQLWRLLVQLVQK